MEQKKKLELINKAKEFFKYMIETSEEFRSQLKNSVVASSITFIKPKTENEIIT